MGDAVAVLRELSRRQSVLRALFDQQLAAVHRSMLNRRGVQQRACLTTRRAGKTYGLFSMLFAEAMANPGSRGVYVMLTQPQCRDVAWPVAKEVNDKLDLGCKFLEQDLRIRVPCGGNKRSSEIKL